MPACSSSSSSGAIRRARQRCGHAADQRSRLAARQRRASSRHRRRARPGPMRGASPRSALPVLPTDHFVFEGFLPRRESARSRAPRVRCAREQRTIVFYEAVHRVAETLAALGERSAPNAARRSRASSRRLTSRSRRARLAELAKRLGSSIPLLGEFVIVVAGAAAAAPDEAERARASTSSWRRALARQGAASSRLPSRACRATRSIA